MKASPFTCPALTLLKEAEQMLDHLLDPHTSPPSELSSELRRLVISLALENECIRDPYYWEIIQTSVLRIPNLDDDDLKLLLEAGTSSQRGMIGDELKRLTQLVNYPNASVLFCLEVYLRACAAYRELWDLDSRDLLATYRELDRWVITHPEAKVALALFNALGDECSQELLGKSIDQVTAPIAASASPKAALEVFAVLAKDNHILSVTRLVELAESCSQLVSTTTLATRT